MTTWKPDTCDCILEFSDADVSKLIRAVRICKFHAAIADDAILAVVRAHNRSFNELLGTEDEILAAKAAERKRIRGL